MPADSSLLGSCTGKEGLGTLHLDTVVIALVVGFARNGVEK